MDMKKSDEYILGNGYFNCNQDIIVIEGGVLLCENLLSVLLGGQTLTETSFFNLVWFVLLIGQHVHISADISV